MEDLHLVDDRTTAEQVVSSCISKGYGLARAKQEMCIRDRDDYVTKPFSPAELTARIDALYRRIGGDSSASSELLTPVSYTHLNRMLLPARTTSTSFWLARLPVMARPNGLPIP